MGGSGSLYGVCRALRTVGGVVIRDLLIDTKAP